MHRTDVPGDGAAAKLLLMALGAAATVAIWSTDPFTEWAYEGGVFLLAGWATLRKSIRAGPILSAAALLGLWGFGQLATGASVYRYATLNESLRIAALGATALVASVIFERAEARDQLLRAFVWFGLLLSIVSVLAYYTSPGKILWLLPSPYPDVWGPFLSRNNFAQFLELVLPASLWLGCNRRRQTSYLWMSAIILACGLASASRAGAVLLILESATVFMLARPPDARRLIPAFTLGAVALAAVAGGDVLAHRFKDPDPFRDRREIFASALVMIAARPWTGYGLGNFAAVYPEFASYDPGTVVEHAHNDWIEWVAEGGWPYSAAWLLLAIAAIRPAIRSIWGIGVPAVFVHALVDYPFARLGVVAWLFILTGALERKGRLE